LEFGSIEILMSKPPLARLAGNGPLVHGKDLVLIGRRDAAEPWCGHAALAASPILDIPGAALSDRGPAEVAAAALLSLTSPGSNGQARGFWIHLDADVINPTVMPAVDSPTPGGPTFKELVELLTPLVRHPRALGLELTIYDPDSTLTDPAPPGL
jgi:arginase